MKVTLFTAVLLALLVNWASADPTPRTERDWKRRLVPSSFKIGMSRANAEKRLPAKRLGQEETDHGFDVLLDVYYELDASWCACAAYNRTSSRLVVQPHILQNTPELRERLAKLAQQQK